MKKRGKWRRAEDQLTTKQRKTLSEMVRDGYATENIMDRFGLTHEEQVTKFYVESISPISKLDKSPTRFSFRTTFAEVARDHVWKGTRTKRNLDNSW